MIDSVYEGIETAYTILDEYSGGALAAKHLSALGHKKTAVVYYEDYKESLTRLHGYTDTARGLEMAEPVTIPHGGAMGDALLSAVSQDGITAVFCYNDDCAVECMRVLKSNGIEIPGSVSILGFDDSIVAETVDPPLTTIAHPKQIMGELAARALLDLIDKRRPWPYTNVFQPNLVVRQSCKKLVVGEAVGPRQREAAR